MPKKRFIRMKKIGTNVKYRRGAFLSSLLLRSGCCNSIIGSEEKVRVLKYFNCNIQNKK